MPRRKADAGAPTALWFCTTEPRYKKRASSGSCPYEVSSPLQARQRDSSCCHRRGTTATTTRLPIMDRHFVRRVAAVLWLLPAPVRAEVDWKALVGKSRELSMSGILGLVETDILFAEPGTEQYEIWRILQSLVGIGCLRVLSRICKAPCWEFLHTMYGIKQPEGVEAREFWLRQPSWTEMGALGLSQEDTSYHRINQGSGPQIKVLWTFAQLEHERDWWSEEDGDQLRPGDDAATIRERRRSSAQLSNLSLGPIPRSKSPSGGAANRDALSRGKTPKIYKTRRGNCVSEGTTDKWFMDRWQCEVLAVAAAHRLSVGQASQMLTMAYFGHEAARGWHILLGIACFVLTGGTFAAAMLTSWSWIGQLAALSCLGYFTTRTACLREWKFDPNRALCDETPKLHQDWPTADTGAVYMRVGVQSSGFCHLRGVLSFSAEQVGAARVVAQTQRGRWRTNRSQIPSVAPYENHAAHDAKSHAGWLSYEIQSSWYGLVATVESDNVALRSGSVVAVLVNGFVLLILGFGASTEDSWNSAILGIYVAGILVAIASRGRMSQWTMPEFQVVDLTTLTLPSSVHNRLAKWRDFHLIARTDEVVADGKEATRMEKGQSHMFRETVTVIH